MNWAIYDKAEVRGMPSHMAYCCLLISQARLPIKTQAANFTLHGKRDGLKVHPLPQQIGPAIHCLGIRNTCVIEPAHLEAHARTLSAYLTSQQFLAPALIIQSHHDFHYFTSSPYLRPVAESSISSFVARRDVNLKVPVEERSFSQMTLPCIRNSFTT